MADTSVLPLEVLATVFAFLDTKSICSSSQVCRIYAKAASEPSLWHEIAERTFGDDIARSTRHLYVEWKEMVLDDNKRGALLFQKIDTPCYYRLNRVSYFFCCFIERILWDRMSRQVRIYLDVRGERDLRHPTTSSILQPRIPEESEQVEEGEVQVETPAVFGMLRPVRPRRQHRQVSFIRGTWTSELETEVPGHFKGYLSFPQEHFHREGIYKFCYANTDHFFGDYESIPLLAVDRDGDLRGSFKEYALDMPVLESEESQKHRWMHLLDNPDLFSRTHTNRWGTDNPSWWV